MTATERKQATVAELLRRLQDGDVRRDPTLAQRIRGELRRREREAAQ